MKIIIRDRQKDLIEQLFLNKDLPIDVKLEIGEMFELDGADALVSPANSFGHMDGGIDLAYSLKIGWHLQSRVQEAIKNETKYGELLIGDALSVVTDFEQFPWLISAPTVRTPRLLFCDQVNVFLASRAAIGEARRKGFKSVVMPGMGTGVARVPLEQAAFAMVCGINAALR